MSLRLLSLCLVVSGLLGLGAGARAMPPASPPIGVFGEIAQVRGVVTLSYRFTRQGYDGLEGGPPATIPPYQIVPTRLTVDTHVLEAMWTPLDEITFVLGLPYVDKTMEQVFFNANPMISALMPYETTAKGFGDLSITLLYRVYETSRSRVHLNLGLSLPSGSVSESQVTIQSSPQGGPLVLQRLPYIMQLGSGTVDLRPGFTYNAVGGGFNWGARISGVLHAGANSQGYTKGNEYQVTGWFGRRWVPWMGTSFRLSWQQVFNPEGSDPLMDPTRSPAEDPALQEGRRLDALFGLDFFIESGALKGSRLAVEAGLPAYQSLVGPQLRTKWFLTAGIQRGF